jgi:nickel/cobalt transporter (NicO) family protein
VKRALAAVVLACAAWLVLGPAPASAHPLGNLTPNTSAGLVVRPDGVLVDYVVDLAEVPTLQARGGGAPTCEQLAGGLEVAVGGRAAPLRVAGSDLSYPPGEGGLATLRLECQLEAAVDVGRAEVRLHDGNLTGRVGWHEVTAVGDGATLVGSDVPERSVSRRLTEYPSQAPLDQRSASVSAQPGGPRLAGGSEEPAGFDRAGGLTAAFTSLVEERSVTPAFGLLAAVLAVGLGCLHALAPGHGKTLMAAYVLGEDSRLRQLAGLGLTVAATHTAGVLVLGVAVSASTAIAPESVLTATSVASGVLLAAVGAGLLVRRLRRGRPAHGHHDHHGHDHPHGHDHDHGHHHHLPRAGSWRVLGMGFAGGLVPSPSALVVLLGATALGRVWFGVLLVVAYGLGMAAALVAAGALLARARPRLDARSRASGRIGATVRALPVLTAGGLLVGGLSLAARALVRV